MRSAPHSPDSVRKNLFLTLRYLFIVAAGSLLFIQDRQAPIGATQLAMLGLAFLSNVLLCFAAPTVLFAWYVEAPILIADTLWVSWAFNSTGAGGTEFFLLYIFVLFVAMTGENLVMTLVSSTAASVANVLLVWNTASASVLLLRIVFFYFVALFYAHVLAQVKRERQRADKGVAWARDLEAKVAERTTELRGLYEVAVGADRTKSEFLANMSHELRTPLNIIMGYADMLLDDEAPQSRADRRATAHRIRGAARSLLALVDGVLELGKLDAGRMPVQQHPVNLSQFVGELRERERMPAAPSVTLTWHVDDALPTLKTDAAKLAMVIDNLVNNAIKFTKAGQIDVRIDTDVESSVVQFTVADTGPGIAASDLQTIFEPFTQVDGADPHGMVGVGLGLAIVKRYVVLLGGKLSVDSIVGSGTTFKVALPYRAELVSGRAVAA